MEIETITMNPLSFAFLVFAAVFSCSILAFLIRMALPDDHRSAETKDTVKLAMGLVATMTALVLGLLVASAKGSYDTAKSGVTSMAAKIDFLDRVLAAYGPDTTGARESLKSSVGQSVDRLWPHTGQPAADLNPRTASPSAESTFFSIRDLKPQNDTQKALQAQALGICFDLGQSRWLLFEQADSSISKPLLMVVVCWLAILFFSFGLFAPSNGTVIAALMVAALSVGGALFLILELDKPFGGIIHISSRPMVRAMGHLGK